VKANRDLLQAASLSASFLGNGQIGVLDAAWRAAIGRGERWQRHADQGKAALLRIAPELGVDALWV
jgi:hypothetical protein